MLDDEYLEIHPMQERLSFDVGFVFSATSEVYTATKGLVASATSSVVAIVARTASNPS